MSGTEGTEVFVIEEVRGVRIQNGVCEYLIKWEGYSESENTWEAEENLDCFDAIKRFQEKYAKVLARTKPPKVLMPSGSACEILRGTSSEGVSTFSAPRGFDRNLRVEKIAGATKSSGELKFLIKWEGTDEVDLVSAKEANAKCPFAVIAFYEERLKFYDL